jgi:hypothetical protein
MQGDLEMKITIEIGGNTRRQATSELEYPVDQSASGAGNLKKKSMARRWNYELEDSV